MGAADPAAILSSFDHPAHDGDLGNHLADFSIPFNDPQELTEADYNESTDDEGWEDEVEELKEADRSR